MNNTLNFPLTPFYIVPIEPSDYVWGITLYKPYRVYVLIDHGNYKKYLIQNDKGFPQYVKHTRIKITRFPLKYRIYNLVKGLFI